MKASNYFCSQKLKILYKNNAFYVLDVIISSSDVSKQAIQKPLYHVKG